MSEPFLGEIRMFSFDFAPQGWARCDGQLLAIEQNIALFTLLGVTYGGDGRTTFALPDLRSRVPVHQGQGAGLSTYAEGQTGGTETVTLATAHMPEHTHSVKVSSASATSNNPQGQVLARSAGHTYQPQPDSAAVMNTNMIASTGDGAPHANIQPYLAVNFCIATVGVFPARP
jgi:microcystin-dependent protein